MLQSCFHKNDLSSKENRLFVGRVISLAGPKIRITALVHLFIFHVASC
ncbi:hypothetical Protein YC6258_01623 [Gynuella sunshinyii YC6258]|uniref:Uncharacterized protein n=1 Tax=Gynuella sunshinyii YC6258 TaxID=1445510 RepID=A0A0C5VHE3_9GAMM|nr:hypothetical Protein YC6258_01623 [Gynuella sunshinyii YC6258]